MTVDQIDLLVAADRPVRDEHDAVDVARRPSVRHDSWIWLPRCTKCGKWIAPPGGEGFGRGEIWCGPCVIRHLLHIANKESR